MPYIRGQFESIDGEPTRTLLRCALLGALKENVPGILAHLFEDCINAARAARAASEHENLICAREVLDTALLDWATCYRLTDDDGRRNRWILDTATQTVDSWATLYPENAEDEAPSPLYWRYPSGSYWVPFTPEEEERWNPLWETREAAEVRHRDKGMTRAEARAEVNGALPMARERWHKDAREAARKVSVTRPAPESPGAPSEATKAALMLQGMLEAEALPLAELMETGYTLEEAAGIMAELNEKQAAPPLPEVPEPEIIRPAPQFRLRKHTRPASGSDLGPLARDFCWLAAYVCTPARPVREFAPTVAHPTLVQRVQEAAYHCGFDLPEPLRPFPD